MKKKAYLIGIKGVAMTALAVYLQEKGFQVTGSDINDIFHTDAILKARKIQVKTGFKPDNIDKNYDYVIATGAHGGATNIEMKTARKKNLKTYMHGQFLGLCMDKKKGISVSGCHGKTTVSALTAFIHSRAGLDPSFAVGTASIKGLGPGGHAGRGEYFISEADEYVTCPVTDKTPRFLWHHPYIAVVTNIDFDHPDVYRNIDEVKNAYRRFIDNVAKNGTIIACADNITTREALNGVRKKIVWYGFSKEADYQIVNYSILPGKNTMQVKKKGNLLGRFAVSIPGNHNLLNSLAASLASHTAGVSWPAILEILPEFTGSKRRFEKIDTVSSIDFFDDYAHHPQEIRATLQAARSWFGKRRILVIFQPHTFSRTKNMLTEFAASFSNATLAIIADIYASKRESYDATISARMLAEKADKETGNVLYVGSKKKVIEYFKTVLRPGDVIFTMGAGDIYNWQEELLKIAKTLPKRVQYTTL